MPNTEWGRAAFDAYTNAMQGMTYDLRKPVNSQTALFEAYWGKNTAASWHDLPVMVQEAWKVAALAAIRLSENERGE